MIELTEYVEVKNTYYNENTPKQVIEILEHVQNLETRIRIYYGDQMTGEDWKDVRDVEGYVSKSAGKIQKPILMYSTQSTSGAIIFTANVVKIEYANKKQGGILWAHPNYHRS